MKVFSRPVYYRPFGIILFDLSIPEQIYFAQNIVETNVLNRFISGRYAVLINEWRSSFWDLGWTGRKFFYISVILFPESTITEQRQFFMNIAHLSLNSRKQKKRYLLQEGSEDFSLNIRFVKWFQHPEKLLYSIE